LASHLPGEKQLSSSAVSHQPLASSYRLVLVDVGSSLFAGLTTLNSLPRHLRDSDHHHHCTTIFYTFIEDIVQSTSVQVCSIQVCTASALGVYGIADVLYKLMFYLVNLEDSRVIYLTKTGSILHM